MSGLKCTVFCVVNGARPSLTALASPSFCVVGLFLPLGRVVRRQNAQVIVAQSICSRFHGSCVVFKTLVAFCLRRRLANFLVSSTELLEATRDQRNCKNDARRATKLNTVVLATTPRSSVAAAFPSEKQRGRYNGGPVTEATRGNLLGGSRWAVREDTKA